MRQRTPAISKPCGVLLEAGADRQATGGTENLDALTRAERKGHREVAGLLRHAGA